jgi:NAD(P)-dependent dehydrogenase (short-subunit alcohol dehydrogenase family)
VTAATTGRVAGKVAVVTGGASGSGRAVVELLAAHGARVVIADVDLAAGEHVASVVRDRGGDAVGRYVDVADETSVADLAEGLGQDCGRVDIVHHSAAITDPGHMARDTELLLLDKAVWDRTLAVDLTGVMLVSRALIPLMRGSGGSIVVTTSNAGLAGGTDLTAYGVAKAGLHQLVRAIATAYGRDGIRCNAVSPGHVASESFARNVAPDAAAAMGASTLLPQLGSVRDIADAVLFLASDESRYITGTTLRVDGGALAHLPAVAARRAVAPLDGGPGPIPSHPLHTTH